MTPDNREEQVREVLERMRLGVNELRQKCQSTGVDCEICESQHGAYIIIRAHIEALEARVAKIDSMAACGTAESFLALSDDDKRRWFAIAVTESSERKAAEARVLELEGDAARLDWLDRAGDVSIDYDMANGVVSVKPFIGVHGRGTTIRAAIDSAMQGEEVRKLRVLQCPECPTSVETSQTGEVDCLRCDATMQADPTAKVAKPSGVRIVPEEPQP